MTGAGRSRPVEFEARNRLASAGYFTLRFSGSRKPVNLVGLDEREVILVKVKRSRKPVQGISEVHDEYRQDALQLRKIGGPRSCRKELWIFSAAGGWKFYEVFPGGIMETERECPIHSKCNPMGLDLQYKP